MPLLKEPNVRDMVLDDVKFDRILTTTPVGMRRVFVFARETGMRKTEVRLLRWDQIDFKEGCVRLAARDTKTERPRIVYLTSLALEIIREVPRQLRSKYVFVNPETGRPWDDPNRFLQKACDRVEYAGIVFHDFRRTFVTFARRRGVPESVIMKLTGHTTRSVFDRYNIIDETDLKAAVATIDRARSEEAAAKDANERGAGREVW